MAGRIVSRKQGTTTYYYFQETFREKINPNHSGSKRGSGKSRVRTRAIYLGTAESIRRRLTETRRPVKSTTRHFGLPAAAHQTATQLGFDAILSRHIDGSRWGIPRWMYFYVAILNRLDCATSKNKMGRWLKKTILPELLGINPAVVNSKSYWYATDDVISEKELQKRREQEAVGDDLFVGLEEDVFTAIERDLFLAMDKLVGLSPSVLCYDTTNFFTYVEEPTPSQLAASCHSKDGKHSLKHVGLLMAVDKQQGLPLLSRVYRANSHDSKVFSAILADLVVTLKQLCDNTSDLVIVLDKGNNSKANFTAMNGKVSWVGSLVLSQHKELLQKDVAGCQDAWNGLRYYRCTKKVMGIDCVLVLTFNEALQRKQQHSLCRGIEDLRQEIMKKWHGYKRIPATVPRGIKALLAASRYGSLLELAVRDRSLHISENEQAMVERRQAFGKNLIFSNMLQAESGFIIDAYCDKAIIESDFQLLKDCDIIRFRPIRHWTDTKIRAYAFCCVAAMSLMRIMQWKLEQAGYRMSPQVLKDELNDLVEMIMIYTPQEAVRTVSDRSAVQQKVWDVLGLGAVAEQLQLH